MVNTLNKPKILELYKNLTPKSLFLIHQIGIFKGKQLIFSNQQPEYLNKLQINTIISNTINSNKVGGLNITYKRFMELFEEVQDPSNNIESEIVRYVKLINLINSHYEKLDLSPEVILQFHKNIFGYKPEQGGNWKSNNNSVAIFNDVPNTIFTPISNDKTELYIKDLCHSYDLLINDSELIDLIVIASFIFDFLCIHPFETGTGRISRLLSHLLLIKNDYQGVVYSPVDKYINDNKRLYLESLSKSSQGWHAQEHIPSAWIEYYLFSVYSAYVQLYKQMFHIKSKRGAKSQQVKQVIDKLPPTFKVADIAEECPGISRPTINKVLQELRDQQLVTPLSLGRDAIWEKLY